MFLTIVVTAFTLALDSLSVSIAGGLQTKNPSIKSALKVGLFLGMFQAGMPLLGWIIGNVLQSFVITIGHWVAFSVLCLLGTKMIYESIKHTDEKKQTNLVQNKTLLLLSIATSIDALVFGIPLSLLHYPIFQSIGIIGFITFTLCFFGFLLGKIIGPLFKNKVEMIGGLVLIGIGIKILVENLH